MQPISYAIDVASPFEEAVAGLKFGTSIAEVQRARQERELKLQEAQQAAQQQQMLGERLAAIAAKPRPTLQDYLPVISMLPPQVSQQLREAVKGIDEQELSSRKLLTGQVIAALDADVGRAEGTPMRGVELLRQRAELERGRNKPQEAKYYEDLASLAEINPLGVRTELTTLGGAAFGKDWIEGLFKAEEDRQQRVLFPDLHKQKIAELSKATSDAEVARINAEYAKRFKDAELAKIKREAETGYRMLTAQEITDRGLPAGAYQLEESTGKVVAIGVPSTTISITDKRGEKALTELDLPRAQQFTSAAASARAFANDARVIADLLKDAGGGQIVQLTTELSRRLGLPSESVAAADLANSLSVRGATQIRAPGSGSTSDTEFRAYLSAFPSLQNSPKGRQMMAKYGEAVAKRSAQLADYARKLIREDRFTESAMAEYDDSLGPVLGEDFWNVVGRTPPAAAPTVAPGAPRGRDIGGGFRVMD